MINDFGHWTVDCNKIENPYGFIYCITNTVNGKKYLGKKQIQTILKRRPLKGKKNKRHEIKETDWKEYTGSSNELNADIAKNGKDKFKFDIIKFCTCKWELSYFEAKYQFDNNVLLSEQYYNGIINLRIGKIPKKLEING
jgi:hypothetical protein